MTEPNDDRMVYITVLNPETGDKEFISGSAYAMVYDDADDVIQVGDMEAPRDSEGADLAEEVARHECAARVAESSGLTLCAADHWWHAGLAAGDARRHGAWDIGAGGDCGGGA